MKPKRDPKSLHKKLRTRMRAYGVDTTQLAHVACITRTTLSHKLCGMRPFNTAEMYAIADFLEIPHIQISEYFPPNGEEEPMSDPIAAYCVTHDMVMIPNAVADNVLDLAAKFEKYARFTC